MDIRGVLRASLGSISVRFGALDACTQWVIVQNCREISVALYSFTTLAPLKMFVCIAFSV